jgi:hypothetical protein
MKRILILLGALVWAQVGFSQESISALQLKTKSRAVKTIPKRLRCRH